MILTKIISGGQSGADKSGLIAGQILGLKTGGTAPKGWRVRTPDGREGSDPTLAAYGLVEHSSSDYPPRTRENAKNAEGTVWFGFVDSPGGKLTKKTCVTLGKPFIENPSPDELRAWLIEHRIETLNVAGNSLSELNPHIEALTIDTLVRAIGLNKMMSPVERVQAAIEDINSVLFSTGEAAKPVAIALTPHFLDSIKRSDRHALNYCACGIQALLGLPIFAWPGLPEDFKVFADRDTWEQYRQACGNESDTLLLQGDAVDILLGDQWAGPRRIEVIDYSRKLPVGIEVGGHSPMFFALSQVRLAQASADWFQGVADPS